jgi:membrane protease YdiL (CAAX protease family)
MPRKNIRVLCSAFLFAFAHIVYDNWIAVILAFVGGLLFAFTYAKTRSTLTCVVEHSVWGILLFTLGLGDVLSSR